MLLVTAGLGWGLDGEEPWAAAEGFVEGGAEVSDAGVADFEGGFGDVVAAGAQQFSGAFESDLADEAGDGHSHLLGEGSAEVEGATADFGADFFEGRGFSEAGADELGGALDALVGEEGLAGAEEVGFGGVIEEQFGGELVEFGGEPERAGGATDGGRFES